MLLINCFSQTLSAVQSGYGGSQAPVIQKCLIKQLWFFHSFYWIDIVQLKMLWYS